MGILCCDNALVVAMPYRSESSGSQVASLPPGVTSSIAQALRQSPRPGAQTGAFSSKHQAAASAARGLAMVLSEVLPVVGAVASVTLTGVIVLGIAVVWFLHH